MVNPESCSTNLGNTIRFNIAWMNCTIKSLNKVLKCDILFLWYLTIFISRICDGMTFYTKFLIVIGIFSAVDTDYIVGSHLNKESR